MTKAHEVLLTDAEWDILYENYPKAIPVVHTYLQDFARLASTPESIVEGANIYREYARNCQCWICSHMLSLPAITGFHLYIVSINQVCAGGNPRCQLN